MRTKGYVVGWDEKGGKLVWTVKGPNDGKSCPRKLKVHSLHPGTMLEKAGDWVTYETQLIPGVGTVAVDVSMGMEFPEDAGVHKSAPISPTMNFLFVDYGGNIWARYTKCQKWEKAKASIATTEGPDARFFAFSSGVSEIGFDDKAEAVLHGLEAMMAIPAVRNAVEILVTAAFRLGRKFPKAE